MSRVHTLVFETTHHALWAEEVAREMRLGAEVVPAPAAARAGCDLAIAVLDEDFETFLGELRERGINVRVFEPKPA
ncbi:MAG TPA: putative Se/S carrier-like protein [Thermoanaerobaculia bacterium]